MNKIPVKSKYMTDREINWPDFFLFQRNFGGIKNQERAKSTSRLYHPWEFYNEKRGISVMFRGIEDFVKKKEESPTIPHPVWKSRDSGLISLKIY